MIAQYSRVRGKHVLELWIRHLAACLAVPETENPEHDLDRPSGYRRRSRDVALPAAEGSAFDPRRAGRAVRSRPERAAARCSRRAASPTRGRLARQWNADSALADGARGLGGQSPNWAERIPSERDDPHYQRTLGASYALGDPPPCPVAGDLGFEELATKVFEPLLGARGVFAEQ